MSKHIRGSMALLSESFQSIDISEEEFLTISTRIDYIHIFDDIPDGRMGGKIKYRLGDILFLIFLAKLRERTNFCMEIAAHIKINRRTYEKYGLITNGQCPSHDTIRRILMTLDGEALYERTIERFYEFLCTMEEEIKSRDSVRHIAVDGKSVRGSGRSDDSATPRSATNILNVYDCTLATCIHSEPIDEKTNEIPVAQSLLESMNLRGVVVTADAMHCQRQTASIIHKQGGYYLLTVKENQPLLLKEIAARFEKDSDKIDHHVREKRVIEILLLPKSYATDGFNGMKAFVRMRSSVRKNSVVRYFITNIKDAELICEAVEDRWAIENGLHKEKDVFFYEDRIRLTNKNAIRNMVLMNNLAMQITRIYQVVAEPDFYMAKLTVHDLPIESIQRILAVMSSAEIIKMVKADLRAKKKNRK